MLPIHNRLGIWQVTGWDRLLERVDYDSATLVVSGVVALLLAGFGVTLFRHQIRAHRVADQRVSFVNSVSHEFGTPLTNILLNLDLAKESIQSKPHHSRQRLGLVTEEVQRLARLVTNVLTFHEVKADP